MPINFQDHENEPTCLLGEWEIADLDLLARILAWLYVRKPKHAAKVIDKLLPGAASFPGNEFDAARNLLIVHIDDLKEALASANAEVRTKAEKSRDTRIEHRDGLLFQHLSWVAAYLKFPNSQLSPPHVRVADKGFDGVIVNITPSDASLASVILCEDKATTNPRNLVTRIWGDIKRIRTGEKDLEILDSVTALLDKTTGIDIEKALQGLTWDKLRHFRVALTAPEEKKGNNGYAHLFDGFEEAAAGDIKTRIAEYIAVPNVRDFLDKLAAKVVVALDQLEADQSV